MDVMLDLETMGTSPDAPIIAIGAVEFNEQGTHSEFYQTISLRSNIDEGAVIDADTVLWWLKQSDAARGQFLHNDKASHLREALHDFAGWLRSCGQPKVWGNGAAFDNVILAEAYRRTGIPRPWPFCNDRCYRTMKAVLPVQEIERTGTHHNALDDAKTQALRLIAAMKKVGGARQ